eukprot:2052617-Alexandrium_andersonii.AAC.1
MGGPPEKVRVQDAVPGHSERCGRLRCESGPQWPGRRAVEWRWVRSDAPSRLGTTAGSPFRCLSTPWPRFAPAGTSTSPGAKSDKASTPPTPSQPQPGHL